MPEITIKDIARECGVGVSTVSRALNNHPDINPVTKKKIMEIIEETGFVPNNSARNLKRTDAKCIAVLVKGITNPLFSNMIKVIEDETQKNRYAMVLQHVEGSENEFDVALELIKEKRLRGIIFLGGSIHNAEGKIAQLKIPFVFSTIGMILSDKIQKDTYSSITVDDRLESEKMTDYLLKLGHQNIAIIAEGSEYLSVGQLRIEGYKDAYKKSQTPLKESLIRYVEEDLEHYSVENGYVTAQKLLGSGEEFTAIYATADVLAIGACRAVLDAGKRIPEDISVVGYDGIDLADYYNPRLTTIKQPVERMAVATVKHLFEMIRNGKEHKQMVFSAELSVQESSGKVPEGDRLK